MTPQKQRKKLALRDAIGYILVAPATVLLCTFTIYPIFYLIYSSLFDGSLISKQRNFVGLGNYRALMTADFGKVVSNTVIYSFLLVFCTMVLAVLFAVWINGKTTKRLNSLTQAAAFTPHIISLVSASFVFMWLMDDQTGFINVCLNAVGLPKFPFMSSTKTALISLVMVMVWKSVGYYTLLVYAALQTIPTEIYEAATLDDTPKIKVFFRITLPMISPTLFFTVIVATIGSFQVFDTVNLMTHGGPVNATNTLVFYIYEYAFKFMKLGLSSAAGVILLLFVGVFTILYFSVLAKKVHYQ